MKKVIALVLVLLLVVPVFAGCGDGRTEVILMNWGEYLDPELIQQFEAENPDIKLTQRTTTCLLYTSPSPRDYAASRMPSSA